MLLNHSISTGDLPLGASHLDSLISLGGIHEGYEAVGRESAGEEFHHQAEQNHREILASLQESFRGERYPSRSQEPLCESRSPFSIRIIHLIGLRLLRAVGVGISSGFPLSIGLRVVGFS